MATGLWTAVSGAAAQSQSVDMVANNLANADTLGYKKDLPTFREYLSKSERENDNPNVPHGPIKDKDFYKLDGRDQAFVITDGTYTNFRQGNLRVTQSPLDVALDGPGFMEVSTPSGIRYTRQGSLKMATDGRLVTNEGFPVLSGRPGGLAAQQGIAANSPVAGRSPAEIRPGAPDDPNIAQRFINLRDRGTISITDTGDVYAGDQLVTKLSIAEFRDTNKLRKFGSQLFENADGVNISTDPQKTQVRQGMLETSNVNPIEEMTNLIKANRLFDHNMKSIKTYSELLGREANDIGKL